MGEDHKADRPAVEGNREADQRPDHAGEVNRLKAVVHVDIVDGRTGGLYLRNRHEDLPEFLAAGQERPGMDTDELLGFLDSLHAQGGRIKLRIVGNDKGTVLGTELPQYAVNDAQAGFLKITFLLDAFKNAEETGEEPDVLFEAPVDLRNGSPIGVDNPLVETALLALSLGCRESFLRGNTANLGVIPCIVGQD